jgi:hypothetical protein
MFWTPPWQQRYFIHSSNPGGIIAVADLDTDNGESHGPGMTVQQGFVRENLGVIFKEAGFTNILVRYCCESYESEFKVGRIKRVPHFPEDRTQGRITVFFCYPDPKPVSR